MTLPVLPHSWRRLGRLAVLLTAGTGLGALAQTDPHHDHHAAAEAPTLKAGQRWETDGPLRKGMEEIKLLVEEALPKAHQGKYTPEEYAQLGKAVDTQVSAIFANCKLPPEADAALHGILIQIIDGSKTVKQPTGKRTPGLLKMMKAVNQYGATFNHPGWTGIQH